MRRLFLVLVLLFVAAPVSAQITKFTDLCTTSGAAENLVTQGASHTTDLGGGTPWTESVDTDGSISLQAKSLDVCGGAASFTSARTIYTMGVSTAMSSADYEVRFTLIALPAAQTDKDPFCLGARITDTTHGYLACIDSDTTRQVHFYLMDGANNGLSPLNGAQADVVPAANDIIRFIVAGDTLKLYGGATGTTLWLCTVDGTLSSTGVPAVGAGNFAVATADFNATWEIDSINAIDRTGLGDDDDCGATGGNQLGALGVFGR